MSRCETCGAEAPAPRLASQAVFGLADGMMSVLGTVLYLSGHPELVFPAALLGGISAAMSMANGEWMSGASTGPAAPTVMGLATFAGTVLPAAPFLFLRGWPAVAASVAVCAAVAFLVARLRTWRAHPYAETYAVLAALLAVVIVCTRFTPGGGI